MSSDPGEVTVTLQLNTPASNGAGGFTESWAAVGDGTSIAARLRNRRPAPFQITEGGPGVLHRTPQVLILDAPGPTIGTNPELYRVVVSGGATYKVRGVSRYRHTVQLDLEVVT